MPITMKFQDPTLIDGAERTLAAAVGQPVQPGKIPNWLRLATIRRLEIPRDQHDGYGVVQWIDHHFPGWMDHVGSSERQGGKVFVSEPYPLGTEAMQNAIDFAAAVSADIGVYAASYHFPTGCIRIEISEKTEDDSV
jgi:hypothetical protein